MAECDRYKLMEQPLCKSLLYKKFFSCGIYIFILFALIHLIFIGIYTTISLRTKHPAEYYSLTNISFDFSLCENVSYLIANGTIGSDGMKQTVDYWLVYILYGLMISIVAKSLWVIGTFAQLDLRRISILAVEIGAVVLGFCFIHDSAYQKRITMRCPVQWQIGAFGLFLSYLSVSYYIQYVPIIGVYVVMMIAIFQRFFLFLPVISVLIGAFGFSFHMIFQNHSPFASPILSLQKAGMFLKDNLPFFVIWFEYSNDGQRWD